MSSIRLKSLSFEIPPFRKLGSITIPFADRITLVAGHNGIGKSTILGLAANGSGLRDARNQSYLNRAFIANLNEIVHLDYAKEYEAYKEGGAQLPAPSLEYEINGSEKLIKRCTITGRTARREVRVVPRNDPHAIMLSSDGSVEVGPDAKVPLPTLFLGMTRMLPVGESNPEWVTNSPDESIHAEDAIFIQEFIADVIASVPKRNAPQVITTQSIKGTKKTAKHPEYDYSTKCISLGQDSLSAIATAVASFKKLQREWPEYPGGLLVIDELDAGFHPHAQQRLVKALASAAKKFRLQIVATTHSVCLIESIHPNANPIGPGGKYVDAVVYLTDTVNPRVGQDYTLQDIQQDMSLSPLPVLTPTKAKVLKIYLEDAEAHFFLARILTAKLKRKIKTEAGVGLKAIPISVGCENLKGLYKHDKHFLTVLIVLDADASLAGLGKKAKNVVKLPGGVDPAKHGLSPERTLFAFINTLVQANTKFPTARAALVKMKVTADYLKTHLLDGSTNINDRVSAKNWMNAKFAHIKQLGLVDLWLGEHTAEVSKFEEDLLAAAIATAKYAQ
jgi:predicted ATPase